MSPTPAPVVYRLMARLLLAAAAVWLVPAGGCAQGVNLKLHLEKGQVFQYKLKSQQHIVQDIQGRQSAFDYTMGYGYRMEVQGVDAHGQMTVQGTYDWVMMDQKTALGEITYDSDHPTGMVDRLAAPLGALRGASFTFEVTPDGRVLAVHGFDAIMDRVIAAVEKGAPGMRGPLADGLRAQFNDGAMKSLLQQATRIYPEARVKVGDTWTTTTTQTVMLPMTFQTAYVLTGLHDAAADVRITSSLVPSPESPPTTVGMVRLHLTKAAGTQTGTGAIDLGTGLYRHAELKQNFSLTVDVLPVDTAPRPAQFKPLSIPTTIEGTMTIDIAVPH